MPPSKEHLTAKFFYGKNLFVLLVFVCERGLSLNQNVGIGTTNPHASSVLDLKATNKGFLAPRLTTTQR
jgi:hypothetical protein